MARETLSGAALCKACGIKRAELNEWLQAGVPFVGSAKRKRFVEADVAEWLLKTGRAQRPRVVDTAAAVAREFGVAERTVFYWRDRTDFPRMPDGEGWDLDAIRRWREANDRKAEQGSDPELAKIRRDREWEDYERVRLANERTRTNLIDKDLARRTQRAAIAEACARLDTIPDEVADLLPTKLSKSVRRRIHQQVTKLIRDARKTIGDGLARVAAELSAEAEGDD